MSAERELPPRIARTDFDHIGIPTTEVQDGEVWLEADGVWVTNPRSHPLNVEWVRYAPNSPMHPRMKGGFHIAYRVSDLEQTVNGLDVLVGPLEVGEGFARVAFVDAGPFVIEFMEYRDPDEQGWFPAINPDALEA